MNVLAFDTCFGAVSVAVRRGDAINADIEPCASGHAERLLPMLDRVMQASGLAFADLDRLAVTLGPGGFTGLRVSIAAVRAFALAIRKPVVALGSLEVMACVAAERLPDRARNQPILVAVDARKGGLFVQSFGGDDLAPLEQPSLQDVAAVADAYRERPLTLVGSGAPLLAAGRSEPAWTVRLEDLQPDARVLARRAPTLTPHAETRPLYLRPADAKPQVGKSLPKRTDGDGGQQRQ